MKAINGKKLKTMQGTFINAEDGYYFEARLRDFDFILMWDLERKDFLIHIREFHHETDEGDGDFATVLGFRNQVKGIALAHDYLIDKGTPSPELDTLGELLVLDDMMGLLEDLVVESLEHFKPLVLDTLKEAVQKNID